MSAEPEPLAAILAEMRDGIHTGRADIIDAVNERLRSYADRIKAAVKREREAAQGARDMRDALEYAFAQKSPKVEQPCNVAALRNALLVARNTLVLYSRDMKPRYQAEVGFMINKCDAALSAPPEPPSNVAAMREAIQRLLSLCDKSLCKIPISLPLAQGYEAEYAKLEAEGKAAMDGLCAALAAPARNCDRAFRSEDEAIGAYVTERGDGPHLGYCDAIKWALAPAREGGDHA